MASHFENLKAICKQVGEALSLDISNDIPEEVMGKLNVLTSLLSTSSHAVALAEMMYNERLLQLVEDTQFKGLTATDKKMVFAGRAKSEIYYVTLTDRQNKAITHGIDGLRSILSFQKNEMSNLPRN